jgi:teichuronic acid biosynthesis glycosyltransferase TuaC
MRALIVTNMYPSPTRPALGSFVRDQVQALRRLPDLEVELFAFDPGGPLAYLRAGADLRRRYRGERFDVVHAHFGLTAWPAFAARADVHGVTMHGTDLAHPRSRAVTLAALRFVDLAGAVSDELARTVPGYAHRGPVATLPCGVDLERFHPIPRPEARTSLGLDPNSRYLLFPADPARAEKRFDRARELAGEIPLLTLVDVEPDRVPLWVNAANAVLVTSEREGFGLAALEALACDVPVLSTPHGIAPEVLAGVQGAYCGPFNRSAWIDVLSAHLRAEDPRITGRAHAEPYSSDRMAARLAAAWRDPSEPAHTTSGGRR